MDEKTILISMSRYIHAFHDIEIDVLDPNLSVRLKRFLDKTDDPRLQEYWDEYKQLLDPNYKSEAALEQEEAQRKPDVYYRGMEVESSTADSKPSKDSGIMYRGNKL